MVLLKKIKNKNVAETVEIYATVLAEQGCGVTFGQARCPALAATLAAGRGRERARPGGLGAACGHGAISARAERAKMGASEQKPAGGVCLLGELCIVRLPSRCGLCVPGGAHRQPAWAEHPGAVHRPAAFTVRDLHPRGCASPAGMG